MTIKPLNHYALENPATVYDEEALTALELAGRTAAKVNECVNETNRIPEKVAEDVQKHIDNGDFAQQVDAYAGNLYTKINTTENRLNAKINQTSDSLNTRMDNLLNGYSAGSTTMDAEVIDGRVGSDNVTYPNLGTAIRTGITRATQLANASIYINNGAAVDYIYPVPDMDGYAARFVFKDRITFMYHGIKEWYKWADITANIADMCVFDDSTERVLTLTMPYYYKMCLVFDTINKQLNVRAVDNIQYGDLLLASFDGEGYINNGLLADVIHEQDSIKRDTENALNIKNTANAWVYIGSDRTLKIETADTGDVSYTYITIPGPSLYFQYQGFKGGKALADITTEIADMVTVDGNNYIITIEGYRKNLMFNTVDGLLHVRQADNLKDGDILLLGIAWNNVNGGLLYDIWLKSRIVALEGSVKPLPVMNDVITTYGGRFNGIGKYESFLFFTDPHLCQKSEDWQHLFHVHMNDIENAYNMTATDFVVCGGDWLGNSDTQGEACAKLGYIRGMMENRFHGKYYNVVGNHDTNYQGVLNDGAAVNTGELDKETLSNIWYPDTGKTYYEFTARNTRFFVFDTGIDWDTTLNAHRMEQVEWFINSLLTNTAEHVAMVGHIYDQTDGNVLLMADQLTKIADAFNNRTSITVNDTVYSFTEAHGKVHFYLGGHRHMDYNDVRNNIPVILTANVRFAAGTTFDLVLIDYDNSKMYLDRCGSGDSRIIDI